MPKVIIMRILLNMMRLLALSCMIVQIDASMENIRRSSRIADLPARNGIYTEFDSDEEYADVLENYISDDHNQIVPLQQDTAVDYDENFDFDIFDDDLVANRTEDEALYLNSLTENSLDQPNMVNELEDVDNPTISKKRKSYGMSYFCTLTQEELNKIWDHPSVRELTLEKIEKKDPILLFQEVDKKVSSSEDIPVLKKSKKNLKSNKYLTDLYETDDFFLGADELELLENCIFDDYNHIASLPKHAAVDCIDENECQTECNTSFEHIPLSDVFPQQLHENEEFNNQNLTINTDSITNNTTVLRKKIPNLTDEQIRICKDTRDEVLQETGNLALARKARKSMYNKFYQSSDEYKNYKKEYYKTYRRPDKK